MTDTIRLPVSATYRIIDGKAVLVSADYQNISAAALAHWLLERFDVPAAEHDGEVLQNDG